MSVSEDLCMVTFIVRADDQVGKKLIRLEGTEFIGRLMLHVLPNGIKRIRHYGVLAAACKGAKLNAARQALQVPALNPQASESPRDVMARVARTDVLQCPCCKLVRLRCRAQLAASRHLPTPDSPMMPANRGAMSSARRSGRVVLAWRWRVRGYARAPLADESCLRLALGSKGNCQQRDTVHRSKKLAFQRKGGQ